MKLNDKVVLVTGAARGQGRSHCVRCAEEGADVVALDLAADVETVGYPLATEDDLQETARLVEKTGRRVLAQKADVRSQRALDDAVAAALAQFGHIDVVVANAGIASFGPAWELEEQTWQDVIDINLTGVWHTAKAVIPAMVEAGRGGSLIFISSVAGLKGVPNIAHYATAKHGLVGLMRTLAIELAPHNIRVNTIHPTNVATPMIHNDATLAAFLPETPNPTEADMVVAATEMHLLSVPWIEPVDISNAVVWLGSADARYVTGVALPVDAGMVTK
jgi:SDR family mycofactocin-dependent oxidoreductase